MSLKKETLELWSREGEQDRRARAAIFPQEWLELCALAIKGLDTRLPEVVQNQTIKDAIHALRIAERNNRSEVFGDIYRQAISGLEAAPLPNTGTCRQCGYTILHPDTVRSPRGRSE